MRHTKEFTSHHPLSFQQVILRPWTVRYSFQVGDREYEGKTTTLRPVGFTHQPAQPTYVLYLETDPTQNTIYPPVM